MGEIQVVLGLFVVVVALAILAGKVSVPYPILLVVGGLALALVSGLPPVELEPDLVLLLFLPPLLFSAAYLTSWRDFRANLRPISLLAVGLVLLTTTAVAVVAHSLVEGLPWAVAFALGAVVSPPDAVAATSIMGRLGLPRRVVTVLEGESLVNDAAALVAYRFAAAAAVTGSFSIWQASLRFVLVSVGGVAVGLAVGWIAVQVWRRIEDAPVEIAISLLAPFAAYLPAEELGASGVLAAVTAGLYIGRRQSWLMSSGTRLEGAAVWEVVVFLFNGLIFVLIGLQLRGIIERLSESEYSAASLAFYAVLASLTVICVRFLWVFPATYLPRLLSRRLRERDPAPSWRTTTIVSWSGMRGVVSLAAALSLPLTTDGGDALPGRDLILFLTFSVILATLLLQGLSLPLLIRSLGLENDGATDREEIEGRIEAARAALARVDELSDEDWVREDTAGRLRSLYDYHRRRFVARSRDRDLNANGPDEEEQEDYEDRADAYRRLLSELIRAQRETLVGLRDEGRIGDEALRRIERDLDLEEARIEI